MNDFTLMKVIGKGSYGKVLLVRKNDSEELLAMKMLRKDYLAKRKQEEHTRTERNILERVKHPFIIQLKYAFQNATKLYFVLEYCPGGELFFHLSRASRFDETRAKFYAACMVLAIEHLHSLDIIYRDLKPENVLVDQSGYAKITDFGLSKENICDNKSTFSFCGTPEYLAPEIINKVGHGKAVDWWSLGALIYEMLTGLPPFYTRDREKLFNSIKFMDVTIPAYFSENAKSIVQAFFIKEPNDRLGSGVRGADEIKDHPWFADINWEALFTKSLEPPFIPTIAGDMDVSNFENEFVRMPAVDSARGDAPVNPSSLTYAGFSYVPDQETMSIEEQGEIGMEIEPDNS